MKPKSQHGFAARFSLMALILLTALTMSAQSLTINHTVNSTKATPITNGYLNALQGSGSIVFSFSLNAKVSSITSSSYTFAGETKAISWSVDAQGNATPAGTINVPFNSMSTFEPMTATITYIPLGGTNPVTLNATAAYGLHIWPEPFVSFIGPTPQWGTLHDGVDLEVSATGGNSNSNGWRYSWSTGANTSAIKYIGAPNTSGTTRNDAVTVTATNYAPDGTSVWGEYTHTYNVNVYSEPSIDSSEITPSNVVFAGTQVTLKVNPKGGNPTGWSYSWTGTDPSSSNTASYTAQNTTSSSVVKNSTATASNIGPDGGSWLNETTNFAVTVWPAANAQLQTPTRTQYFSGEIISANITTSGGDPASWSYTWQVDNTNVSNSGASFNYTASNSGSHNIKVTAVNEPSGVNAPYTYNSGSFAFTVFQQPEIATLTTDKAVVFTGTTVELKATTSGGNPNTWTYAWKRNGADIAGNSPTLTDTPTATDGVQTYTYTLTATNTAGETTITRTKDVQVTVWPEATATFTKPEITEWLNGQSVPFSVNPAGGDSSKWTYMWKVDNQPVSNTAASYTYLASNTGTAGATHTISVTATNAPDGIDQAKVLSYEYTCTVYPTPTIMSLTSNKKAVFSGTDITFNATVSGGKPDAWVYSWKRIDVPVGGNSLTMTDNPPAPASHNYIYTFTAVNTCAETVTTLSEEITVEIWPTPSAEFTFSEITEWLNGQTVPFSVSTSGGDETKWSYVWKLDGQTVANTTASYNYLATNTGNAGASHKIVLTATNAPSGIDNAKVFEKEYECIVYPTPEIKSLSTNNKDVVFNGTPINITAVVSGGQPDNWTYTWKRNGSDFAGDGLIISDTPSASTSVQTYTYTITAVNTCAETVTTLTKDVVVTVWPEAKATLNAPTITEWFNGHEVPLSATVSGGDSSKWTYKWTVDGQTVDNTTDAFNYIAFNNGSSPSAERTIVLTATNTPDGIDNAKVIPLTYTCIVYPTPAISSISSTTPVVFNGTTVEIKAEVSGGKPGNWTYFWQCENAVMPNANGLTITDTPKNEGSDAKTFTYKLTATNVCDSETITLPAEFTITVWPTPKSTLVPPTRNEWIEGETLPFTSTQTGGNPEKWSFVWKVDGVAVDNNAPTFDYIAVGDNNNPVIQRTIELTATNTPDGINAAYSTTQSWTCTVFTLPKIVSSNIDKPVVFSGTEYEMSVTVGGGNPDGWTFEWTRQKGDEEAVTFPGDTNTISDAPVNNGTTAETYIYKVIARNNYDGEIYEIPHEFYTTVWPTAEASLTTPTRTRWNNGEEFDFTVNPSGGNPEAWTYTWAVDGENIGTTTPTLNLTASNLSSEAKTHKLVLTAVNSPSGIDKAYTFTQEYDFTVYPTPAIVDPMQTKTVVYSGTAVNMSFSTVGYPDGWEFEWTCKKDNESPVEISGKSNTLTVNPINTNVGSSTYTYTVTATNNLDDQVNTRTHTFNIIVWSTPEATLSANIPENVLSGEEITMPVTLTGGDYTAWNLRWTVDGEEVQNSALNSYKFKGTNTQENGSIPSTVTVEIINNPTNIDKPYTSSFSHTFLVWPCPTSESIIGTELSTCAGRELTLGVTYVGGQESEWTFAWKLNGKDLSNNGSTLEQKFSNTSSSKRTDTYTLNVVNKVEGQVRYEETYTYTIDVYPAPETTQGYQTQDIYYGNNADLYVKPSYGYPQGWNYKWTIEGREDVDLGNASDVKYAVPKSEEDSYEINVSLTVTNGFGEGEAYEEWYTKTYEYTINAWSRGEIWSTLDLPGNIDTSIETVLTTEQKQGYSGSNGGWTYEWTLFIDKDEKGQKQGFDGPSLSISENNYTGKAVYYDWMLVATNKIGNTIGSSTPIHYTYTLWPEKIVPERFVISNYSISNGSTITLNVDPTAASGGYEYTWNYNWTSNGNPIEINKPLIYQEASLDESQSMSQAEIVYGLTLINPGPYGEDWYNKNFGTQTVTVYNRPSTPTSLQRKGNGTTCTLIVLTDMTDAQLVANDYTFVFGYTDASGVDHAMAPTAERYYRFEKSVYDNASNDFWVYARWSYTNGSVVTSCRRHLSGTVDNFDGSTYDTTGRGDNSDLDDIEIDNGIYVDARGFKVSLDSPEEISVDILNTAGAVVFHRSYGVAEEVCDSFRRGTLVAGVYIVSVKAGNMLKFKKVVIK